MMGRGARVKREDFPFVIREFNRNFCIYLIWQKLSKVRLPKFILSLAERTLRSVHSALPKLRSAGAPLIEFHTIIYRHLVPLERKQMAILHLEVEPEVTNEKWKMINGKSLGRSLLDGRRAIFAFVLVLLCAAATIAQENKCALKLAELPASPELFGFHMGMTTDQAKARVPQIILGRVDDFGVTKTSINPDFDPKIDKASLNGIRTVSLDFLDARLTSLWFGYDGTFKWTTVPDFVAGISQALHLPDAWKPWKIRGQQLNCADFQMTVTMVAEGPSFRIIDDTAQQTIAARREAKEEQDSAAEEAAGEIIADKKDKVYYVEGCLPPKEIKAADRVAFKSPEEAERAGFKLARGCE